MFRIVSCLSLVICLLPLRAAAVETNILTGGPTGTYIQIGRDIAAASAECDVSLAVQESAGSLENFLGVRQRRFTQFGIVQSDVLEYLKTFAADDPELQRAVQGVRIAFPLYDEEVHVLARKEIGSLKDLAGKRVSIGRENSGSFLTASVVLDLVEVTPAEKLTLNQDESLTALVEGRIDAFFYVAGAPAKLFTDPRIDAQKFRLVPVSDPVLREVYKPVTIPAGTYPFQPDAVEDVAVKAVLMTYAYDPRRNAYHRESCRAVAEVAHVVSSRFQQLRETGHPKWRQVDLTDIPPGWDISDCVNAGLAADFRLACDAPGATTKSAESEANQAYRRQICAVVGCAE